MNRRIILRSTVLLLAGLACLGLVIASASGGGQAAEPATAPPPAADVVAPSREIGPRADRILSEMSEYLGSAEQFALHAEITYDAMLPSGQLIQYGGSSDVSLKRPGRLRTEYRSDERNSSVILADGVFTAHDLDADVYTVVETPPEIDAALDHVFSTYGLSAPIADLVYSDPYGVLTEAVEEGYMVGRHLVDGVHCFHLAFTQEAIDWQIWIEDGPRPLPRKLIITYKQEDGSPQYTARFTRWDFDPDIADGYFRFDPPADADQIEILPVVDVEEPELEVQP